jgi:hypothetical protein
MVHIVAFSGPNNWSYSLVGAEQAETEELLQGLEDLKQQHKTEALLQSVRHSSALAHEEAAGEQPVLQQLEEERSRTARVHAALRKKQTDIAERIAELRAAPINTLDSFIAARYDRENASTVSQSSDQGRDSMHGRQRQRDSESESVLRDVVNQNEPVEGTVAIL